jgi:quercetin dioxygenase-like cupin family protein
MTAGTPGDEGGEAPCFAHLLDEPPDDVAAADAVDLGSVDGEGGVVWSASPEGVHVNLVVLAPGQSIAAHRNDSLDVLLVLLDGTATATVRDAAVDLEPTDALLVPKGATRAMTAGSGGVRYLTVHAQRPPLAIGSRRQDPGGGAGRHTG